MKNTIKCILLAGVFITTACDNGFESLNKNPNAVTGDRFNPSYLFSTAQYNTAKGDETASLFYGTTFVQQMATLSDVGIFDYHGDKYVFHKGNNELLWKSTFNASAGSAKLIVDALELSKGKDEYHNLYQMARIWKTIIFHRLTDIYGDVPYSEAGLGYYQRIFKPKYDTQKDIYYNMLAELEDATSKLSPDKATFPAADITYGGDLTKWKKLGYSMMLRLGLRLSKIEPATAEAWVKKAYAGGVFTSVDDNLFIRGTDKAGAQVALTNGESYIISVSGVSPGKIAKTFFDFLKSHNDPRLKYTVAVYSTPTDIKTKNTDPAVQKGLPNGLNITTLPNDPSYNPNAVGGQHQYSGVNRDIYAKLDGPRMFITYGEVQFMLAEAAVRGWITGDAKQFYENGVAGAMKNVAKYEATATISDAEIAAYLTANPFVGTTDKEKAYEQINTQYWAATFLNGYEAFANVRRSGYPKLTPIDYSDNETQGKYPRRLFYPEDEGVLNPENLNAAIERQGVNQAPFHRFETRVWWDKQ